MNDRGCTDCECLMYDVAAGVDIPFRYDTMAVGLYGNGLCIPYISEEDSGAVADVVKNMVESFKESDSGQMVQSWMDDIVSSWIVIVLSTVTAVVLGYIYLMIISCIGGVIIWVCIWVIVLGLAGLTAYCFYYRE